MPTGTAQEVKSSITIKGNDEIICEYLDFGINSILFQRRIYPPEDFKIVNNYGLSIYMSSDEELKEFLNVTLNQLKEWLVAKCVEKVSLIVVEIKTKEILERWDFKVEYSATQNEDGTETTSDKPLQQIQKEICDVLKQIYSSVSFLPLLDTRCSIDLLVHTNKNAELPASWEETASADIKNAQSVTLRSFSTNIHRMNTVVIYKSDT